MPAMRSDDFTSNERPCFVRDLSARPNLEPGEALNEFGGIALGGHNVDFVVGETPQHRFKPDPTLEFGDVNPKTAVSAVSKG